MALHLRQRNGLAVACQPSWRWSVGVYVTKESIVVRSGVARRARQGAYETDRPLEAIGVRTEPDRGVLAPATAAEGNQPPSPPALTD